MSESDQIEQSQMPSPVSSPETTSGHNAGGTSRPLKRRRRETSLFQDFDAIFGISEPTANSAQQTQFIRHHSYSGLKASSINRYEYVQHPPSTSDLLESLQSYDLPDKIYREPYYSNNTDVPRKARTYAGLVYHLKGGRGVAHLEPWKGTSNPEEIPRLSLGADVYLDSATLGGWEYASCPPSVKQVKRWLQTRRKFSSASLRRFSQVW